MQRAERAVDENKGGTSSSNPVPSSGGSRTNYADVRVAPMLHLRDERHRVLASSNSESGLKEPPSLPLGSRIKAIAKQVQKYPGHLLQRQFHQGQARLELALQDDVEVRILSARTVIGEVQRLVD